MPAESPTLYGVSTRTIGVRQLRAELAAVLRHAGAGERIVVTVDGRPVAEIGPVSAPVQVELASLAAAGLIVPPGRRDRPPPPDPSAVPVDARVGSVLDDVRG